MTAHGQHAAAHFVDAVVRQLSHAHASHPDGLRNEIHALLDAVQQQAAGPGREEIAQRLVDQPVILSVFFQNVDLLYEHEYPGADALSLVIMNALEILDRRETET